MSQKIIICLILFSIILSTHTQEEFTIPKKNRVIQENPTQSRSIPVNSKITNFNFKSLNGNTFFIDSLTRKGPVVFVFLSVECPVAQRYTMRLKRMYDDFFSKGVTFVGVYSNENDSVDDVIANVKRSAFLFPIVKDYDGSLARHLGATMTPQAHLIENETGVLRYRGAIDDNRIETRVKFKYLEDAIIAVLDRKPVPIKETAAFGCTIHLPETSNDKHITYTEHIAKIINNHCQNCHNQNGIAPFSLTDYDDVKKHSTKIAKLAHTRQMPPWNPVYGYVKFKNERYLSDNKLETISNWVKAGCPQGTSTHNNSEDETSEIWKLGKPDKVFKIQNDLDMRSVYPKNIQSIILPNDFEKDMYIRAIDFQIDNKYPVNGIIAKYIFPATSNTEMSLDGKLNNRSKIIDDKILSIWSPSAIPSLLPEGIGYFLPSHANLKLLINYKKIKNKNIESIDVKVGIYLSKSPQNAKVHIATLSTSKNQQQETLSYQFNSNVYVIGVFPSIPSNLQELKLNAFTPTGEKVKMLWYRPSNISWHEIYNYNELIFLPKNTRLEFDEKSTSNINNSRELFDNKLFCQFYYVLASEYDEK